MTSNLAVDNEQIEKRIATVKQAMKREVASIEYRTDFDWTGDPAIFFMVILNDAATRGKRLGESAAAVRKMLWEPLDSPHSDMLVYVNFRGKSEHERLIRKR